MRSGLFYKMVLVLFALFISVKGDAQCIDYGLVVEDSICDVLLIQTSPNGDSFLEVHNTSGIELTVGTFIDFGYELANTPPCTDYLSVDLTCAEVVNTQDSCTATVDVLISPDNDTYVAYPYLGSEWILTSFEWALNGAVVGDGDYYEGMTTDSGELCLTVATFSLGGEVCSSTTCILLDFTNGSAPCVDSILIDFDATCGTVYAPVCGCDSVTYANECEAMYGGGVVEFTPGSCQESSSCHASFTYQIDSLDEYKLMFFNTSVGGAVSYWLFSDGAEYDGSDVVEHNFQEDGAYIACLVVGDFDCLDASCQLIIIGDTIGLSGNFGVSDYVFPGDIDTDGSPNLNDALWIGLGYGSSGFPRPGATTDYYGQMAFDWGSSIQGINMKHIDCNGDGDIDYRDVNSIFLNGVPMPTTTVFSDPSLPVIYLNIETDTVYITDNSPMSYAIQGDLMLGSGMKPVYDLAGISVGITYPEGAVKDAFLDYKDNSFLGSSNELLIAQNDFPGQLDMAFVRNNHVTKNGYGAIGRVDVIIDDVFTLRTGNPTVDIKIKSVKALDMDGNVKEFSVVNGGVSTVVFVDNTTVGTMNPELQRKVKVYPSLVSQDFSVSIKDLHPNYIEVYDLLAQKIHVTHTVKSSTQISTYGWVPGQYIIKVFTEEGVIVKKIIKT